jgi:hypothetical protein
MTEADRKLRQIAGKVSQLNKSSDEINDMIVALEEKLEKMNIGVEVWVSDPDENFFDPNESFSLKTPVVREDENDPRCRYLNATLLGYQKLGGKWRIVAWSMAVSERPDPNDPRGEEIRQTPLGGGDIRALVDAPRECRIAALKGMPLLFEAIENKVDVLLRRIEEGKKQAEALL